MKMMRHGTATTWVVGLGAFSLMLASAALPSTAMAADHAFQRHTTMCDASAGAFLGEGIFVAANDEDNILRIFRSGETGPPIGAHDLTRFLRVEGEHPETDLEGAAWLGDRLYWISSHGRNKDGKYRENRHQFFATEVTRTRFGYRIRPVGKPYHHLLRDLLKEPHLGDLGLSEASMLAPKAEGGFNIESLAAAPDGRLWVGFRNPLPQGRALLVPLFNPAGVIAGQSAQFGEPTLLNLDGRGIRDMIWTGAEYLIIGGSYDGNGVSRLYRWRESAGQPEPVSGVDLSGFNPEAVLIDPSNPLRVMLLSDDGTQELNGVDCKALEDPTQKRFRSWWVSLEKAESQAPAVSTTD